MVAIVYTSAKEAIELETEYARGGEACIYRVREYPDLLAKIYNPSLRGGHENKLAWMMSNPPDDPARSQGHASLAWPCDLLFDERGGFVGYLMPFIKDAVPILQVFNPHLRRSTFPDFTRKYLYRSARNLASAVAALHARDYIIGDLNESNVLVTASALVTIIDTDSFQVQERNRQSIIVYPCPVGKPEYTPPELQGKALVGELRRPEHDSFALAVLIFQLLTEGNHPFRSCWLGPGDPPSLEEKIRLGYFPHVKTHRRLVAPPPNFPGLHLLYPSLTEAFRRCFHDGYADIRLRPAPADWVHALQEAEQALVQCEEGHIYSGHLKSCPYCEPLKSFRPDRASLAETKRIVARIVPNLLFDSFRASWNKTSASLKKCSARSRTLRYVATAAVCLAVIVAALMMMTKPVPETYPEKVAATPSPVACGKTVVRAGLKPPSVDASEKDGFAKQERKDVQTDDSVKNTKPRALETKPEQSESKERTKEENGEVPQDSGRYRRTKRDLPAKLETRPTMHRILAKQEQKGLKRISSDNADRLALIRSLSYDRNLALLSMAYSPSGRLLAGGMSDGTILVWRVKDGQQLFFLRGHLRKVKAVAFSPDGTMIGSGSADYTIRLWRAEDGQPITELYGHQGSVTSLAFSPDGKWIVSGSEDNTVRVWRVLDYANVLVLRDHLRDITAVAFSPDGRIFASSSDDFTVRLRRTEDGTLISAFKPHPWGVVGSVAFSPEGLVLATGSQDYSVKFWRVKDLTFLLKLIGHQGGVKSLSFSPDGELLLTGSEDGTARLWRVKDGALLRVLSGNTRPVQGVAFAPDGTTLAVALDNGTVNIWGLP